ncbi:uncharacterized protein [Phaseolus vulgaris]|uniref:uncharacterized protein n=1 Tax=Phaseolus vulgaris TaxID=3885 RepID=UPI0035CB87CB
MITIRIGEADYLAGLEADFVPTTMKSTKAQTWVRIYHFPLEYWKPRTIFSIVRGIGTTLSLDEHTMRKNRGMFARVLVDIDLLSPLSDQLLVERPDFAFVASVEYEWLPPFCSHCKMIGHELAQCRVIHDQGCVPGPQHKPSQKTSFDEREQGRTVIPKQRKEYIKKDPETKLVEGLIDKLKVDATSGVNVGSPLGHLASDKTSGGEDDLADMPPLEDASDHDRSSPKQGLSTPTLDSLVIMQAKDSESNSTTLIDDHHVEVSVLVIVPSLLRTTSPRRAKSHVDTNAPVPNVEVSTIVTVPSQSPHTSPRKAKYLRDVKAISLVLQNHFSSLDDLETTDAVSKFWADSNEMKEDASDNKEETVRTKRKPERPPKRTSKSRKTAKTVLAKNCSDHSPILASLASNSLRKVNNFRFFSMWVQDTLCLKLIHDSWANKGILLGIQKSLKIASLSDSDGLLYQEKIAKEELDHALHCQYLFWKKKTKMLWFKDGDRNTAFFHAMVRRRNNSSGIHRLRIDNEENMMLIKCPDFSEIKNVVFNLNGLSDSVSIPDTVSQFWTDESGRFTLKLVRTFFLELGVPCGWGKFIWFSSISPSKTLVLWKKFHGQLPTDQHIRYKG